MGRLVLQVLEECDPGLENMVLDILHLTNLLQVEIILAYDVLTELHVLRCLNLVGHGVSSSHCHSQACSKLGNILVKIYLRALGGSGHL